MNEQEWLFIDVNCKYYIIGLEMIHVIEIRSIIY